ncbi:hypothetical protein T36_0506 [Helicobacter cinaedi]|uniref:hypothetical protein n=1 Tax=Helicobacter cinaedi TaxID=213 RepID=UPI001F2FB085|nr:hypothetical protein [Helicobacter cinaedi]BDB64059.1 hypothetical protein T36_0506 [Helicobacter cinaedi]
MSDNQVLSLDFFYDIAEFDKILHQSKDAKKLHFFTSSKSLGDNDSLYLYLRYILFSKGEDAQVYSICSNDKTYIEETYIGLEKIKDSREIITNDDVIYATNKDTLRSYCKAIKIRKKQIWDLQLNIESICSILEESCLSTKDAIKIIDTFKQNLLNNLKDIQDSQYFNDTILPQMQKNITDILQKIQSNIEESKHSQWFLKITRSLAVVLAGIIDLDIRDLKKLGKKLSQGVFIGWDIYSEISDIVESHQKATHYALHSALIYLLISEIAPMVFLCKKQFMNEILFYDDDFIDFYAYSNISKVLPTQYTFIKGQTSNIIETLSAVLKDEIAYTKSNTEYSLIQIDSKEYSLEQHIASHIQTLDFFFFAEYENLNSASFIEIMKAKAENEESASSFKEKGYLFITQAPNLQNAGLNKEIISMLGLTAQGYQKQTQTKQQTLSGKHQAVIDYSNYTIKQDKSEFKHIVLQLSPFIKLPDKEAKKYQKFITQWGITQYVQYSKQERALYNEISSFFQLPNDIEEIQKKEKILTEHFLELIQEFLDKNITLFQSDIKRPRAEIIYSIEQLLSFVSILCIIHKEFDFKAHIYTRNIQNFARQMQGYAIKDYGILYILTQKAFVQTNTTKIPLLLSQNIQNSLKPISNALVLEDLVKDILQYTYSDDMCIQAIDKLKSKITSEEDKQELAKIESEYKEEKKALFPQQTNADLALMDKQLNAITIQSIFQAGLEKICPSMAYFNDKTEFLVKMVGYFIEAFVDMKGKSLLQEMRSILAQELGILAICKYNTRLQRQEISKKFSYHLVRVILHERSIYLEKIKISAQQKTTIYTPKQSLSFLNKQEFKSLAKGGVKGFIIGAVQASLQNKIKQSFPTTYEKHKNEYESLYYQHLRYKYNMPYAVDRKEFVSIPMSIYNAYMCFDLSKMLYGSKLSTGGLKYHSGLAYSYECQTSNANTKLTKDYVLQKILGYILLEELRGVSGNTSYYIDDFTFFANGFNKANVDILKTKKELYKLLDSNKLQSYRKLDSRKGKKAIDAYNTCIDILSDIANDITNINTQTNTYEAKIKILLEHLKIIGENNIKAMYVGVGENQNTNQNNKSKNEQDETEVFIKNKNQDEKETRPKFIGRLATTIIMEDGLYIG